MGRSLSWSVPHSWPRTKGFLTDVVLATTFRVVIAVTKKKNRKVPPGPEFVLDAELVPSPERMSYGAPRIYFPFDVLELGRSFTTKRHLGTVRKAIRRYRAESSTENEYAARELVTGGCRVWRMK